MASNKRIVLNTFDGGLDTVTNPSVMDINKSPNLLNVDVLGGGGSITSRKGYQKYYAVGGKPVSFAGFYRANDITTLITVDSDGVARSSKISGFIAPRTSPVTELNPELPTATPYWGATQDSVALTTTADTTVYVPIGSSTMTVYGSPCTITTDSGVYTPAAVAGEVYSQALITSLDGVATVKATPVTNAPVATLNAMGQVVVTCEPAGATTANAMDLYRSVDGGAYTKAAAGVFSLTTIQDSAPVNGVLRYKVMFYSSRKGFVLLGDFSPASNAIKVGG